MSDLSLETEHHIERDAIGGAMSVKLVSWSEPLKITANHPDVVERNARYLGRLYHEAKVKEPPVMEWTFWASAMQAYTGDKETLFSHVVCMESKQHMFWIHYLREPFSTKAGDSAVHRHTLHFGHGTNTAGVEGIMNSCYLAPATIADGAGAVGHYSQASPWGDSESLKQVLDRVVQSGKWQCPLMVHGFVMTPAGHHVMESGGGTEAQQACVIHAAVHFKRDKKNRINGTTGTEERFSIAQPQPRAASVPQRAQSSPTQYDTNREYGLNLPRQVVSNKFTRDLQIDGMDISKTHRQSLAIWFPYWMLMCGWFDQLVGQSDNSRHTVWESFKSRQEAITAGTLMRALRGENSTHYSGADLNSTLTHMTKNMFPGQDPYLWHNRYMAIKELAKELAKVVAQKGPSAASQSMLQQIQELQRENARLKSGRAPAHSSTIPASPAHDEIVSAAIRFGLDAKLASRLSLKNLSATIAVAQFEAA
ncbi:unnamed protein product [Symbiodinium necroappetens]|uniref:Uncharacterized protein n=1 Tax=Symbiodinium necroappetens TaxID=1628268 RepID=A0A813A0W6_9DINO|nr:unnamed protein product [Symbiodinium necroappetens]